jgi:hypothetical protein
VENEKASNRRQWELIKEQGELISEMEAQIVLLQYKSTIHNDVTYRLVIDPEMRNALPEAPEVHVEHLKRLEEKVDKVKESRKVSPDQYIQQQIKR